MNIKSINIGKSSLKTPEKSQIKNFKKIPELFNVGRINKNRIVFSPLLQRIYLMDGEAYDALNKQKIGENELLELIKSGIFVENPEAFYPKRSKKDSRNTITIFLTTKCNLRCKYCYASGGENPYDIDFGFVKTALNRLDKQNCNIAFHGGGEPFQAFGFMKKIADYARLKFKKVSLSVSTNGMLTDEKIDWIIDNFNGINLSADGPPLIQDVQRPLVGNKPSSNLLENTLKKFDDLNWSKNLGARSTISSFSVKKSEEIVDYFHEFGIVNLHFEPLFETGRAIKTKISAPDINDYVNNFLAALELAESYGMNLRCTLLPIEKKFAFCGASGSNFSLTTDGFVSACHEAPCGATGPKIFIYGQYDKKKKKIVINQKRLGFLKTRTIYKMKSCQNCIAKWGCAGGCLIKCFQKTGSLFKPDKEYCDMAKRILESYIRYRVEKDLIKIKPYIEKSGKNQFYVSFFKKQKIDTIKNGGYQTKQPIVLADISPSKTDFDKLLKNILTYRPRLLLSFDIKKEDLNRTVQKNIGIFLEKLKKNKICFKITKPLPKCLFGIKYGKFISEFNTPTNCNNCFEMFKVDQKGNVIFCENKRHEEKINLGAIKSKNDIINIFNAGKRDVPNLCNSCMYYLRRSCNGLCL